MNFSRRTLLKRMPVLPFAVGAAVTQVPVIAKQIAGNLQNVPYRLPSMPAPTLADRIKWFERDIEWLPRPELAMYQEGQAITANAIRSIQQWDVYIQNVTRSAQNYTIPLEEAFKIANIPH